MQAHSTYAQTRLRIAMYTEVLDLNVTAPRAEVPKKKRNCTDFHDPHNVDLVERLFSLMIERFRG